MRRSPCFQVGHRYSLRLWEALTGVEQVSISGIPLQFIVLACRLYVFLMDPMVCVGLAFSMAFPQLACHAVYRLQ
jgi:hypothetical protein